MEGCPHAADKRSFFDAVAAEWEERGFTPEELVKIFRLRERLGPLSGKIVFEPGAGAGRLTRHLSAWVAPGGKVIAVDDSPVMAERAARMLESLPPAQRIGVELACCRAEDASVPEASVDLALLFCVFPHIDDKELALQRFARMLKADGRLVISHLEGSERLNAMHAAVGEAVRMDRLPPVPRLEEVLHAAGLRMAQLVDQEDEFYLEAVPVGAQSPG